MPYRNYLIAFSCFLARGYFVYYMKNIGGIVPIAARIADTYRDIFENHKSIFVFERLMRDETWFNRSVAVFAIVFVHSPYSSECGDFVDRNNQEAVVSM